VSSAVAPPPDGSRAQAPDARVEVAGIPLGAGCPLVLIAGPCVIEDEAVMKRAAGGLRDICRGLGVPLIFKSSYEKDNRSAPSAERGPGLSAGLALLARLRSALDLPVTSDVHRASDVGPAAEVLDLLQVPALLCRQTSLLEAAGRSGRPVNLKKGQFLAPRGMTGAVEKVRAVGGRQVMLTERGTTFGYDALVCDMTAVPALQALGCPVAVDAGHAANERGHVAVLARCGVAAGADALFIECHPDPPTACCDSARMLSLEELEALLREVLPLAAVTRRRRSPCCSAAAGT